MDTDSPSTAKTSSQPKRGAPASHVGYIRRRLKANTKLKQIYRDLVKAGKIDPGYEYSSFWKWCSEKGLVTKKPYRPRTSKVDYQAVIDQLKIELESTRRENTGLTKENKLLSQKVSLAAPYLKKLPQKVERARKKYVPDTPGQQQFDFVKDVLDQTQKAAEEPEPLPAQVV